MHINDNFDLKDCGVKKIRIWAYSLNVLNLEWEPKEAFQSLGGSIEIMQIPEVRAFKMNTFPMYTVRKT